VSAAVALLLADERYEEALGLPLRPTRADIRRAHMRLLVENKSHPETITALNRAETVLAHEGVAEVAARLAKIGQSLSRDGQKEHSLLYLRAAVELRATAIDFHWLGSTLVQLGKPEEAIPFLEKAVAMRDNPQDQEWLDDARAEIETRSCWFCGQHPPDAAATVPVSMHKVTSKTPIYRGTQYGTHYQWRKSTVAVPRCPACQKEHVHGYDSVNKAGYIGLAIGIVFGVAAFFVNAWLGVIAIQAGPVVGLLVARTIAKDNMPPITSKSISEKSHFPAVKRLLADGWQFGDKPPGL